MWPTASSTRWVAREVALEGCRCLFGKGTSGGQDDTIIRWPTAPSIRLEMTLVAYAGLVGWLYSLERQMLCQSAHPPHCQLASTRMLHPPPPLLQDPNCVNVADWYQSFEAVHTQNASGAGGSSDAQAAGPGSGRKKAAVKKAKRKGAAGAQEEQTVAEGAAGSGSAAAASKARRLELAARFSHAAAELQYVGLIKPAKRRRGDFVQRVLHMPATGS